MKVLHSISDLSSVPGPLFLAIGVFDGLHRGHEAVIRRALEDAQTAHGTAVVVTFDPHPARVLRPQQAPRLLTSTAHKIRLVKRLGVSHLLAIPFDAEFAATPPDHFIRDLATAARPLREICVGFEWCFGRRRTGNLELLRALGAELNFNEVGVPAVESGGQIVSSTLIRCAVEAGDLPQAARLLGRPYTILGTVAAGNQLGRKLGFPTANLSAHSEQFPPDGVYAAEALWREQQLRGVVNIGVRPTLENGSGQRVLELHLFEFDRDVYGEDIEVTFVKFLRSERKFGGLAELKAQIALDAEAAREALAEIGMTKSE